METTTTVATRRKAVTPPSPRTRAKMPPWYSSFPQLQQEDGTWINSVVEQSIELLTLCDVQSYKPLNDPRNDSSEKRIASSTKHDYARLHDEFLESLLQEQARVQQERGPADDSSVGSSLPSLCRASSFLTISSSSQAADSTSTAERRRRRRPIKLSRRPVTTSPTRLRKTQVASIDSLPQKEVEPRRNSILTELSDVEHPEPSTYLHTQCRLQKDKGKGEAIGAEICAHGREACLIKVQQKMELLTQIAMSDGMKRAPDMQRKKARITEETAQYVETRSLIQLKMGFLSMQYGVLLRWDPKGKVKLVVLRKSCHDSFYKKSLSKKSASIKAPPPEWLMLGGSHAVFQRPDGTEVALLDAPYRVERPLEFEPSRLLAQVARVEGLKSISQWFLKVKFEDEEYRAQLFYNSEKDHWSSTQPFEWEVPLLSGGDSLEIVLQEQKRPSRTRKKDRLVRHVSLAFLDPTRISERRQVCVVEDNVRITLNVYHQSDYAYWLHQELEARKRAEVKGFVWKMPVYKPPKEEEVDDPFWDLCCIC